MPPRKEKEALAPFPPAQPMGHETVDTVFPGESEDETLEREKALAQAGLYDVTPAELEAQFGDASGLLTTGDQSLAARLATLEADVHWLHQQLGATISTMERGISVTVPRIVRTEGNPSD